MSPSHKSKEENKNRPSFILCVLLSLSLFFFSVLPLFSSLYTTQPTTSHTVLSCLSLSFSLSFPSDYRQVLRSRVLLLSGTRAKMAFKFVVFVTAWVLATFGLAAGKSSLNFLSKEHTHSEYFPWTDKVLSVDLEDINHGLIKDTADGEFWS